MRVAFALLLVACGGESGGRRTAVTEASAPDDPPPQGGGGEVVSEPAAEGEGEGSPPGGSPEQGEGEGEGAETPDDPADPGLPDRCKAEVNWAPGVAAFREATTDWGFDDLGEAGVQGVQLSVVHLDDDGRPDLFVRAGDRPYILRNTPDGFVDVTDDSGIIKEGGGPIASGDVDGDGDVDIYVPATVHDLAEHGAWSEVWLNNGDGTFVPGPQESDARYVERRTVPAGATFTDVDRDGRLDLWVTHNMISGANQARQDDLFVGAGGGAFDDVTFRMGLATQDWGIAALNRGRAHSWAWSSAACDLNGDGWPELLASSYGRMPNHLWQGGAEPGAEPGTARVSFDNRSVASGYAFDHRQDWWDDLSAQCFCQDNPGARDCDQAPDPDRQLCASLRNAFGDNYRWDDANGREPFRKGGNSGATVCADMDNDGHIDLMTGEIRHSDVGAVSDPAELLVNTGEADVRFERPGLEATGLARPWPAGIGWDEGAMTLAVLDFDNDGWQDVYYGLSDYPTNRGRMYHQVAPREFEEVPTEDLFDHLRSHGVVAADFDLDGDLDVVVGHSRMRCGGECYELSRVRAFENIVGQDGNWVRLRLTGDPDHPDEPANSSAIGARVTLTTPDGVTQTQEVDGGHGHFNTQKDLGLHFGLGQHCAAEVQIRWPNRSLTTQTLTVQSGYAYAVPQGADPLVADPTVSPDPVP